MLQFEDHRSFRFLLKKLYRDLENEMHEQEDNEKIKRIKEKYRYLIDDLVIRQRYNRYKI
jgi:hypothetical protein